MKKSVFFISCDEAKHLCDKSQYNEISSWERFKLSVRLSWCGISKAYTKRNNMLTNAIENANVNCLKPDEKETIEKKFNKELTKTNP